jgi:peptidoglycan/xylan/chitin deacetylase (PgdA/CDA1 family)
MTEGSSFWPGGARLAVSVSMQFEAGGQPISGAGGPITEPILSGFPDLGQNTFYEYGAREGVSRLLDLFDKHGITITSFMIGDAVRRHPDVAAEIVARGHEAGAHGRSCNTTCPARRKKSGSQTACGRSSRSPAPAQSATTTTGSGPG